MPETERNGRVHTSTVTVAVIYNDEKIADTIYDKRSKDNFSVEWTNGNIGAGGQAHQKTQTCCRLRHIPTGIVKMAQTRSRANSFQNATEALCAELDRHKALIHMSAERAIRKDQVGSGQRGDKRRTIRFRDNQVTDHITGKSMPATDYMKGHMDKLWS